MYKVNVLRKCGLRFWSWLYFFSSSLGCGKFVMRFCLVMVCFMISLVCWFSGCWWFILGICVWFFVVNVRMIGLMFVSWCCWCIWVKCWWFMCLVLMIVIGVDLLRCVSGVWLIGYVLRIGCVDFCVVRGLLCYSGLGCGCGRVLFGCVSWFLWWWILCWSVICCLMIWNVSRWCYNVLNDGLMRLVCSILVCSYCRLFLVLGCEWLKLL